MPETQEGDPVQSPEAIVKEAERRYHLDAEFHAKVERTMLVLVEAVVGRVPEGMPTQHRRIATLGVAVSLLLAEAAQNDGSPPEG